MKLRTRSIITSALAFSLLFSCDEIDDTINGNDDEQDQNQELSAFVDDYADSFFNLEPYPIITSSFPDLTTKGAYDFLDDFNVELQRRGVGDQIGWKLGFTGAMRPFGAPEPTWGRMFSEFERPIGATISKSETFIVGSVGYEVAVIIGSEINGFVTPEQAREAVEAIAPAFEFADIAFQPETRDADFRDVIAMNSGGRVYIVGEPTSLVELDSLGIDPDQIPVLGSLDGEQFLEARTGLAVDGLFNAISFLSSELADRGEVLLPGDIVFSGALMGDQDEGFGTYSGDYGVLGTIEFTLTE